MYVGRFMRVYVDDQGLICCLSVFLCEPKAKFLIIIDNKHELNYCTLFRYCTQRRGGRGERGQTHESG